MIELCVKVDKKKKPRDYIKKKKNNFTRCICHSENHVTLDFYFMNINNNELKKINKYKHSY